MTREQEEFRTRTFLGLLIPHHRQIYLFILYLVGNGADADDILQDTLAEMWKKFGDYSEGTNFVAWSRAIAKYKVLQFIDNNKPYRFHFDHELLHMLEQEIERPRDEESAQEKIEVLNECVRKLTQKDRHILALRYEKDLTLSGIAKRYGISIPGIYKILSQIHDRLARCIRVGLRNRGAI